MSDEIGRRRVLSSIGAAGVLGVGSFAGRASADREPGTEVTDLGEWAGVPVRQMSMAHAAHPTEDAFALATGAFGDGIELYLAEGAATARSVPETVSRLSTPSAAGAFGPAWADEGTLRYTQDYARKELDLGPSAQIADRSVIDPDVTDDEEVRSRLSLPVPIPGSLPFDICAPMLNGNLACVQTGGIIDNFGAPRDCSFGETPPLVSADITYQEETIPIWGDGEVVFSNEVWIGIETDGSAVWIGEETSEQCASYSVNIPDPTAAPATLLDYIEDAARDLTVELGYSRSNNVVTGLMAIVVIALILAPPTGFPG